MEKQVAYSLLEVKAFDDRKRTVEGFATTPTADRVGDEMNPFGMVRRTKDIKLHLYHNATLPVGTVVFGAPEKRGVPYRAEIPEVTEEGTVKARVDEAWHSIKYNLISAVSIGFMPIRDKVKSLPTGGLRFEEWEIVELSLTSVPANPEAILRISKAISEGGDGLAELRKVWAPVGIRLVKATPERRGAVKLLKPSAQ